jgi:hypothetical protein
MPRPVLDEAHLHPAIRERVARHQRAIVNQVSEAVVVVGMAGNPHPTRLSRRPFARPRRRFVAVPSGTVGLPRECAPCENSPC